MGVNLRGADLSMSSFDRADLTNASLALATCAAASFREANLSHSNLLRTYFHHTDLHSANLYGAAIDETVFIESRMSHINLAHAVIVSARFLGCDLSTAKGLNTVRHQFPSTIGIETLYDARAKVPEAFLRRCGVPEELINIAKSLAISPIEFYSCFISYCSKDQDFADRLYSDLQSKGVRCWFAPEDLKIGDKFRIRIDESIRIHDKLLLVLSEHSVSSDWVEKEVETAMERERQEERTVLFPIRLDDAVMDIPNGWPADIRRTRHIGDFTKWKNHDHYQKAFDRLLRDLKSDEKPKSS
jgi:hypothetical protein